MCADFGLNIQLTRPNTAQWLDHSCESRCRVCSPPLQNPNSQTGSGHSLCPPRQTCSGTARFSGDTRVPPPRDEVAKSPVGHTSSLRNRDKDTCELLQHVGFLFFYCQIMNLQTYASRWSHKNLPNFSFIPLK